MLLFQLVTVRPSRRKRLLGATTAPAWVGQLAEDGGIADPGGWGGVTIGHCVGSPEAVERILAAAQAAGAAISSPGRKRVWGGYSGIFRDLDGHSWEIEHNPFWTVRDDGSTTLGG